MPVRGIVENHPFITPSRYTKDIGFAQQTINRRLISGDPLPGIIEYYKIDRKGYILRKAKNYARIVSEYKSKKRLEDF